jgi:2-phosphoglycerate kinase
MKNNHEILLLGGASGTGKSSISYELGKLMNMNIVQVDD